MVVGWFCNHSNFCAFLMLPTRKKGLVVVVVLLPGEQKMVGFFKSCFKGKKNIYGGGFFLVKKQKTTFALKKHITTVEFQLPSTVSLHLTIGSMWIDPTKLSDRCSRLKDWRQENFHLPSTMRSMYFFEDEKMATFSSPSSYSFQGYISIFKSL